MFYSEDENHVVAAELRTKKVNFMGNAWDVFRAGVSTGEMDPFRRMMNEDLDWLSDNNIEKIIKSNQILGFVKFSSKFCPVFLIGIVHSTKQFVRNLEVREIAECQE
ncbi:hypothetical protein SUGI_0894070 [Cryptomeria japonica]|nr:hypothetical protein SUGI_0894070 [Cryptomeria japonica]